MGHNYLEKKYWDWPKYTGTQLFRGKTYWDTAIVDAKHSGTQLFRAKTYWDTGTI